MGAATADGETVESALVFLAKEALEASAEDAAQIGRFCLDATRLLMAYGVDPSCCLNDGGEASLTQTSLEHFDLLFPLAALLVQSGASLVCSLHGDSCWSAHSLLFQRLQAALPRSTDAGCASELLEQAEVLLDLARVDSPLLRSPPRLQLPAASGDPQPYSQALADMRSRVLAGDSSPPSLRRLCRAFIRAQLQPWPLEDRVKSLPLPDRLKSFLLPELAYAPKPGWDRFRPQHDRS